MGRILVVEDEPDIALGLVDDLTVEGHVVEVVADGLFRFKMIGGDKDDQGLLFKKSS